MWVQVHDVLGQISIFWLGFVSIIRQKYQQNFVSASSPCTGLDFYFLTCLFVHYSAEISTGTGECKFTLHLLCFSRFWYVFSLYLFSKSLQWPVSASSPCTGVNFHFLTYSFGSFFRWNINSGKWVQVHFALFTVFILNFGFWQVVRDDLCKITLHVSNFELILTFMFWQNPVCACESASSPCTSLLLSLLTCTFSVFRDLNIKRNLWVQAHLVHFIFLFLNTYFFVFSILITPAHPFWWSRCFLT